MRFSSNPKEYLSIYLHIPFCATKCAYCAFNTYTHLDQLIPQFVEALVLEIHYAARQNPYQSVGTIYFGGGTPSLLEIEQIAQILDVIYDSFNVVDNVEITFETNPDDLSLAYVSQLRTLGINRISVGIQSANAAELQMFGRRHGPDVGVQVMKDLRSAGFDNVNLDLIFAVPNQTLSHWQCSIEQTLRLQPEHLSLYSLILEENTPLESWVRSGRLPAPDDDLAADMYEYASKMMQNAGYEQYELSNWAKPGFACKHNLQYWRNLPYIGLGPGAHGYAAGIRYANLLQPRQYIEVLHKNETNLIFPRTPATADCELIDEEAEISETLMMGLRLTQEGNSLKTFRCRFGYDLIEHHADSILRFVEYGMLELSSEYLRITEKGRLLSNMIIRDLI
jgi:oxygen-independent coproporphyrinogen-3 oxidase